MYTKCSKSGTGKCDVDVKFGIAKWVFVGCIIFSFLLLGYEVWKARQVIQSRDIAYAFTNLMANDYYSLKKYDNFCLFCKISKQNKKKDKLAFFIFFTFKGELTIRCRSDSRLETCHCLRRPKTVHQRNHPVDDSQSIQL